MTRRVAIVGGAGPREAAAIVAAVAQALAEEEGLRALPPARPEQSPWVLAGRPREVPLPTPEHSEPIWGSLD
jgi:hypothetical protein